MGLFIIFFFSFFSHNAMSATTIEDTTFPADVGKTYTWKVTNPPDATSARFTYKSESIDKGVHNSIDALIVNCTMRGCDPSGDWTTYRENELYLAANQTQNYLAFGDIWYPFIIPTPINLALVAEAIAAYNYSIVDNKIIEITGGESETYSYNTEGILTSYEFLEDETYFRFVLATGGEDAIPFGNYFLIFIVISGIALVYLKKQKIN